MKLKLNFSHNHDNTQIIMVEYKVVVKQNYSEYITEINLL